MSTHTNEFGQPIGAPLPGWAPRLYTLGAPVGRYCRLEKLDPARHGDDLFQAYLLAPDGRDWTYLPTSRFTDRDSYIAYAERLAASADPLHYAVIDQRSGKAVGSLSHMRIDPTNGVVEVGFVVFSPLLQRTPISTEAQFLLMQHAFDTLGYRRYEWKCDNLNAPSKVSAQRLGFTFEGVFRQATVYKQRSRDTAWFSIIDSEWPLVRAAFQAWLAPENFDADGRQRQSLGTLHGQQGG